MDIASTIGSVASGGVLGGLFSLGNAAVEFANSRMQAKEQLDAKRVDNDQAIKVLELTQDRQRQQAEESVTNALLAGRVDEMKASFDGLAKSFDDQIALSAKTGQTITDILALFRPSLTVGLVACTALMGFTGHSDMFQQFLQLATMATAWWFGDRQRTKFMEGR
jgi:hypothetical protein